MNIEQISLAVQQFAEDGETPLQTFNRLAMGFNSFQKIKTGIVEASELQLKIEVPVFDGRNCKYKCGGKGYHAILLTQDGKVNVKIELCCGRLAVTPYTILKDAVQESLQINVRNFEMIINELRKQRQSKWTFRLSQALFRFLLTIKTLFFKRSMEQQAKQNIITMIKEAKTRGLSELEAVESVSQRLNLPLDKIAFIWREQNEN